MFSLSLLLPSPVAFSISVLLSEEELFSEELLSEELLSDELFSIELLAVDSLSVLELSPPLVFVLFSLPPPVKFCISVPASPQPTSTDDTNATMAMNRFVFIFHTPLENTDGG